MDDDGDDQTNNIDKMMRTTEIMYVDVYKQRK